MASRGSSSLGARARPGKAACSFPQGIVEIVLRIIVAVSNFVISLQARPSTSKRSTLRLHATLDLVSQARLSLVWIWLERLDF